MLYCSKFFLFVTLGAAAAAPQQADPVAQSIAQGDAFSSKRDYDKALDAYHKADKLAHHSSARAYLKMASIDRKLGDMNSALDDAKHALQAAGDNKSLAVEARLFRASLLAQMASKPTDKKLKDAEEDARQAVALDPEHPTARFSLGVALLRQERDSEGIEELNKFVASSHANPSAVAEARSFIATPIRAREPFAPAFVFTTLENQSVSNAALRGKVVLLDFWGTWCPPCRESVPMLRDLNKKYAGKPFQLVGISSDSDEGVWRSYIEKERMNWSEYLDLSGRVQEQFHVESYPTYIVVDKDGVVRYRQSGVSDFTGSELEDVINKALKKPSDPALAAVAIAAPPAEQPRTETASQPASAAGESGAASLAGVEVWTITAGVYKNEELGMSFELPKGWTTGSAASLHDHNQRTEAQARASLAQQHPEATAAVVVIPKVVLYASLRGGTPDRSTLPSLRISASQRRFSLPLDRFKDMVQRMPQPGLKTTSDPAEVEVNHHRFLRADLDMPMGSSHLYRSYIETGTGDYTLTIEFFAASKDDLERIAASLNSLKFEDED